MSELTTAEIFTDGQQNINAANMNGIVGKASVQPDIILAKPASAAMDVADQFLVLKTDNTLARSRFDTIVNSTSSNLPLCDTTKNGMLRQVSGKTTDVVDGTNNCVSIHTFLPAGVVVDYAGPNVPAGWLYCSGQSVLRTDYPDLFIAIGTTYGSVDSTHFTLPDYRGKLTPSAGGSFGALGANGGAATVVLAIGNMPSHNHDLGNHVHNMDHCHGMANHTHLGVDHLHSVPGIDHTHPIPAGQFNHLHTYIWPSVGGSQWAASPGAWGQGSSNTGAATLPAGATGAADRSLATTTGAADRGLTTGGPSVANTIYASQTNAGWVNTQGPSANSGFTGSGTAFSILPPFQTVYKIIKV